MLMHMLIEQTEADVLLLVLSVNEAARSLNSWICCALRIRKKNACWFCHFRFPLGRSLQCSATGDNRSGIFSRLWKTGRAFIDSMTRYARALRDVALASESVRPVEVIPPPYSIICPACWNAPGRPAREALLPLYGTAGKRGRGGPDGG